MKAKQSSTIYKPRMIGPADLPTVTKADFLYMLGERGIFVRPGDLKYLRYDNGSFWFIMGGDDENTTEPGCASSWRALTQDGRMCQCFEIYYEVPIRRVPAEGHGAQGQQTMVSGSGRVTGGTGKCGTRTNYRTFLEFQCRSPFRIRKGVRHLSHRMQRYNYT